MAKPFDAGVSGTVIEVKIADHPPVRLDKALARDVPAAAELSRSRLARLIAGGAVTRAGAPVRNISAKVAAGEVWRIIIPEAAASALVPEAIPLDVVYEDAELIVVNKPAGMVVHPAPGWPSGTLVNALLAHCGENILGVGGEKRPGIVHRIDKDTSGLLVAAKTDRAHHALAAQFEAHSIGRHYLAVVHGVPDAGNPRLCGLRGVAFEQGNILRITTNIARHRFERKRMAVSFQAGRHAVTRARVMETFGRPGAAALVECWLETGRTHQIRVHLAHVGHALIGDRVYGGHRKLAKKAFTAGALAAAAGFRRQALHARTLEFEHPLTGARLRLEAPIPADMAALIAALRGDD